jgi:hypothetical protein
MEQKTCSVFVDGKECNLPLIPVALEAEKIARYDLVTYACGLGHRSYFLLEPEPSPNVSPRMAKMKRSKWQ